MRSSVGILAQNEATRLPALLEDLWRQSWFTADRRSGEPLELLCVVNGSSDPTAAVAQTYFDAHPLPGLAARVIELERPGKANAWNRYVHEFSMPAADVLFLVDGDIRLPEVETLALLADALEKNPDAVVAVDRPVKTFRHTKPASGTHKELSLAAADLAATGTPKLCGQLYAARSQALRKIPMPEGLLVEDGFLKAMLLTDLFTTPENSQRIVRPDGARHTFEAETAFSRLLRHECRIVIGTVMNVLIFSELRTSAVRGEDVAELLRQRNQGQPGWMSRLTLDRWRRVFGGVVRESTTLPLRQWQAGNRSSRLLLGALVRSAFNLLAGLAAWRELRRGRLKW